MVAIFPSTVAGEHEEDAADGRRGEALALIDTKEYRVCRRDGGVLISS